MNLNKSRSIFPKYLSPKLVKEVRDLFEPRYNHYLSDEEVIEIAENLAGLVEIVLKVKHKEILEKKEFES